jgi:hypothetical protein
MTIDERLEKLAERHEALTLSVEILTRDVETLRGRVDALVGTAENLVTASAQDAENIRALARIAEIHEHRLTDIEERGL